ncbi:MAG: endonuclease Q family protein [Candidatus Levybacteria bacterium]|nr:endonuclease Q family protein [Candidatus Levybacteria bacterium]
MEFVADLHLHSKYSRAVSQNMVLPIMAKWAQKKGLGIISSSDWTHPLWLREMKAELEEASEGLYKLKGQSSPLFLLSTEIASIYTEAGKLRRIHNLLFSPNIETAEKINKKLLGLGCNLSSDGRPIIGLSSRHLLELVLEIDERIMLIPCHIWTPHFGMYGSASGFDSLNQAFGELDKYIYGIETGLSSDPAMNWQVEELDNRSILSFSDAHSPAKMGREATVFTIQNSKSKSQNYNSKLKISYDDIAAAIKRDPEGKFKIGYTIEFYPEEGKYHFSGHRNCKIVRGPNDTKTDGNICPVCKRRLTEGVLHRVQQLAKKSMSDVVQEKISPSGIKWHVARSKNHPPFVKLVPFLEVIAEAMESTTASIKVKTKFDELCAQLGTEIEILLRIPIEKISQAAGAKIAEGVAKVRNGNIAIDPGYDGEYGKVKIWNPEKDPSADSGHGKIEEPKTDQIGLQF